MLLQFVAVAALAGATAACAQIVSPDVLVSPPPRAPDARQNVAVANDLQWLWQYAKPAPDGAKAALLGDPRFAALLREKMRAPQAFWSAPGSPLAEAARAFLAGDGVVASSDNRHLIVTGCVAEHCAQRGMLWADLGERNPLLVFAALRWNEQGKTADEPRAPFTLWIFPTRDMDAHQLPDALKASLSTFVNGGGCKAPNIVSAIVVDPNGVPHILGALDAGVQAPLCSTNTGTPS